VLLAVEFIAIFACLLFTGAALYITLVEHPARMECGIFVAATEFVPSYKRATVMQVSLAIVSTVSGIASWMFGGTVLWLLGSILMVAVIPFTVFFIMPVNNVLLDKATDRRAASTNNLLVAWGRLHAIRTVLSLSASVIFLLSALSPLLDH
jgi:hypothetical protein